MTLPPLEEDKGGVAVENTRVFALPLGMNFLDTKFIFKGA